MIKILINREWKCLNIVFSFPRWQNNRGSKNWSARRCSKGEATKWAKVERATPTGRRVCRSHSLPQIRLGLLHDVAFVTDKPRNFKFGTRIDFDVSHLMDNRIPPKRVWWGSGAKCANFRPSFINLERGCRSPRSRNFKFGMSIVSPSHGWQITTKGYGGGPGTKFVNFGPPLS